MQVSIAVPDKESQPDRVILPPTEVLILVIQALQTAEVPPMLRSVDSYSAMSGDQPCDHVVG